MPVRQGNQRETASQKGTDYSDAVIQFQKHRGYFLDARAEDSGEGEDIIFVPKAGNRDSIVTEAKFRSPNMDGFSPNNYVTDLAKRFYQWEEGSYEGYEFHLFTSKSSNPQLWKDLFKHLKEDTVKSFFEKMKEDTQGMYHDFLNRHEPRRFRRFLENSYIWLDYSIGDLERIVSRVEETGEYDYDPYVINYTPIQQSGIHKTNLLKVAEPPPKLFKIPSIDGLSTRQFHSRTKNNQLPVYYHSGQIYSLVHPDNFDEQLAELCSDEGDTSVTQFEEFAMESPSETEITISKVLIRGVVTTIADRVGAVINRDRRGTRIYMKHNDEDIKIDGKWATKELETGEVRHRSVEVFVKFFEPTYYIGLYPSIEFTTNGEDLVSGSRKKHLSDRFNPGKFPQNSRKSATVEIWLSKLALEESLKRFSLFQNLQEVLIHRVDDLILEGSRPPRSGKERNEHIEDQLQGVVDVEDEQ